MTLWVSSGYLTLDIECASPVELEGTALKKFGIIHQALWGVVGRRLVQEAVAKIAAGEELSFGDQFRLGPDGAWFWHGRFFESAGGEWRLVPWKDIRLAVNNGRLEVTAEREFASFSYRDSPNVEILETLLKVGGQAVRGA